jgi:hypothetical protein
MLPSLA